MSMSEKLLIINADDFGIHEDVNDGIAIAYRNGIVRSTSLMVNMQAVEHAVQLAKEHPDLGVGLHLNISSGHCVAPVRMVDQLVDSDGRFLFNGRDIPGSMRWLKEGLANNPKIDKQISIEFESQIERFNELGLDLEHITIHHYLSLIHPRLFRIYIDAAGKVHCPVRALCYPMSDVLRIPDHDIQQMEQILQECRVSFPSYSISNLFDGTNQRVSSDEYRRLIQERLSNLSIRNDIRSVEIVTHPTVLSQFVRANDSYVWARELETNLVTHSEFHSAVENMNYRITGYSGLSPQ